MIVHSKATRPYFSYRYFSRVAGFASPNFLKLVAEGQRNLSTRSIGKFARGLGLTDDEHDAFEALVLLDQASSDSERNRHFVRLRSIGPKTRAVDMQQAQYQIYSMWYALPIRELVELPDFQEDPVWIGRRLQPTVRPAEVRKALTLLEDVGLLVRSPDGKLQQADPKIATAPSVQSLAVRNYHRAMLEAAAGSLDGVSPSKRDVTSLTLALSPKNYEAVCARVAAFRRELLELIDEEDENGGAEIYQVGFQVFPLTDDGGAE